MYRILRIIVISIIITLGVGQVGYADTASDDSELQVSSSRLNVIAKAGETKNIEILTSNKSTQPMEINLRVRQFTTEKTPHDVTFSTPKYDWVHERVSTIELAPGKSKTTDYQIEIPSNAAESEYYYALLASTTTGDEFSSKTVQVATLLYLYIDGGNLNREGLVSDINIPSISFAPVIPYEFTIKNSGNIHFQASTSAQLRGYTWGSNTVSTDAVILPERSRDIKGAFTAPLMPGLYTVMYGYMDESSGKITRISSSIIYIPPWSIALFALITLSAIWLVQRRSLRSSMSDQ